MLGKLFQLLLVACVGAGGWLAGSLYPAPPTLLEHISPQVIHDRAAALSANALTLAAAAGQVITVERTTPADAADNADADTETAPGAPATAAPPIAANQAFVTSLSECPGMTVSNGPRIDATRKVIDYTPIIIVNTVPLALDPTSGTCLSSGFGTHSGRLHKGIDYYSATGGPIRAAGDGTVIEMKYRDDYGNMLLIDHGHGVYTRYAHLSTFDKNLKVGAQVKAGDLIGLMGNTAGYPIPIHLHYELLTGDYNNPKASFGLTPVNPFSYTAQKS